MVGKNKNEVSSRLTPEQCLQQSMDSRVDAMNKALGGERVRYRSSRNPDSFVSFLEGRLEIWDEVKDKLDQSGLSLSGGQQQRLCIARTIAVKPDIILMDEPFGALDAGTRYDAQMFLIQLWEELNEGDSEMTVLFVTHALEEAVFLGSRMLAMSQHWEHDDGPQRTDNGSKFVLDYDLTGDLHMRRTIEHLTLNSTT